MRLNQNQNYIFSALNAGSYLDLGELKFEALKFKRYHVEENLSLKAFEFQEI